MVYGNHQFAMEGPFYEILSLLNLEASSSVYPQGGGCERGKQIDLQLNHCLLKLGSERSLSKRFTSLQKKGHVMLTSIGSIINHDPKAIFKAFLFCHKLCSIKKAAKDLTVPLLGL